MSSPITTALRDILGSIDLVLLKAGFKDEMVSFGQHQRNIRDVILDKIIYEQVLPDMSLIAASEFWIPLKRKYIIHEKDDKIVVSIPANVLGNRSIITPLQVAYTEHTPINGKSGKMESDAFRIIDHTPNITGTVSCELKKLPGENTVLLTNFEDQDIDKFSMEVTLGIDGEFSTLPAVWWKRFSKLCVLRTKAYLNVNQVTVLDIAESNAGVAIPNIRRLLEKWDDSLDLYNEELDRWTKFAQMYDDNANADFIQLTTSFN